MTIDEMKAKLAEAELGFEQTKSRLYAYDGVVSFLRQAIANETASPAAAETPENPVPTETPATV